MPHHRHWRLALCDIGAVDFISIDSFSDTSDPVDAPARQSANAADRDVAVALGVCRPDVAPISDASALIARCLAMARPPLNHAELLPAAGHAIRRLAIRSCELPANNLRRFCLSLASSRPCRHVEFSHPSCRLARAGSIILAGRGPANPKTPCDLESLIRHLGFALHNDLVRLSPAVGRKRHPS